MRTEQVNFIAHARIKDIVGRGLINDDNVAIIELIKNAKDAGSKKVNLFFGNAVEESADSAIIVQDFGQGMSYDDIRFKWLNIAYSEKKYLTRKSGNALAGNKGIGRFSCDRLGKKLSLYTRSRNDDLICLEIDWTKFEVDDRDTQIGRIKSRIRHIDDTDFEKETGLKKFSHGTTLVIRELRSIWPKQKLVGLRKELERFVVDPTKRFRIFLTAEDYPNDSTVNCEIQNKIFENLDFRATSIGASIPKGGEEIRITLRHDGENVFELVEKNAYRHLKNINMTIFFLNQYAKAYFKRQTGYRSVDYGSIFLFLNGFRVLPYGQESDDWLGLDRRKQQGTRRFLSTRDTVGFIEIEDRDETFLPISSREGLVRNAAFHELTSPDQNVQSAFDDELLYGLFHKAFRKLERFVVEGLDWDRIAENAKDLDEDELLELDNVEFETAGRKVLNTMIPTITIRTPRNHIQDVKINYPYVVQIAHQETASYQSFVDSLQRRFEGTTAASITPAEKRNLSRFIQRQAKELAAKESSAQQLEQQQAETEHQLQVETKRRLFAEVESTSDQKRILQLHHQIGLISGKVFKAFDRTIRKYRVDPNAYTKEQLFALIERSIFDIDKIRKVSKFASRASFDVSTNRVKEDLIQFIEEYIENFNDLSLDWNLKVQFINQSNHELVRSFRPIELSMLIDNLIDNAGKASAKTLRVEVTKRGSKTMMRFVDDGKGLPKKFKSEELFHSGVTTTSGSGIGLRHAKQIVDDLKGQISISDNDGKGATVRIDFEAT